MNTWTDKEAPPVYEWTGPTGKKFRDIKQPSGVYYHDTTPPKLITELEEARRNGSSVRLFYGDRETGKDWMEEHDVSGTLGSSMGPIKIPLIIGSSRSSGGPAILADCIVCLLVDGRQVYRHPNFKFPEIRIAHEGKHAGLPWAAWVDGEAEPHARFKTQIAANRWKDFMQGNRMSK